MSNPIKDFGSCFIPEKEPETEDQVRQRTHDSDQLIKKITLAYASIGEYFIPESLSPRALDQLLENARDSIISVMTEKDLLPGGP